MALATQFHDILRFGTFEVDLRAGELRKQGKRIKIQDQPFHVLTILLQRPGEVVTREELRNQNWPPDTFVDFDNSLNTAINKLREALGDSADNPRFIETLPRRGYRFLAAVTSAGGKEAATVRLAVALRRQRWKVLLTLAAVLVMAMAGGLFWRSRPALRLTERDTLVLADFVNTTGDPVFDDTLKQGLRVQLEQSPFLNILSDQSVTEELRLMRRTSDERLTSEIARDLCQRVGSKAVLAGSISSLGAHYVIGLSATNCQKGDVLASEQVEAATREHVLEGLDKVAMNMRKKLGESLTIIQKYGAPLEQVTTTSLEALKAYSLGMKIWNYKGNSAAIPFFRRAVDLDPKFAMAYSRLGTLYGNSRETALSVENARKAYALGDNVSARERFYISSHYYHFATGDLEKAAEVYELWHQTYPQDNGPLHNLATIHLALGNCRKALDEFTEEFQEFPRPRGNFADINLVFGQDYYLALTVTNLCLNRPDAAQAVLKQAEQVTLEGEGLLGYHYLLAFLKRNEKEMQQCVATASDKPGVEDVLLSEQADTEAFYGHLIKAREFSGRAVKSARRADVEERAAIWMAVAALREAEFGNAAFARKEAKEALALTRGPSTSVEALAGLAFARAGDTAHSKRLADQVTERFPAGPLFQDYWVSSIRAAIELDHRTADKSIELLRPAASYELGTDLLPQGTMYPVYLRGVSYLLAHQGPEAATEFQKLLDHDALVLNFPLGSLAHLGLGRAYALQHDTAKARSAYQDFLTLWKDGDAEIPVLKQAKAEYAKLQ